MEDVIKIAVTDQEIMDCFPAMASLRENLTEAQFLEQVSEQSKNGYALAYLVSDGKACCVAGFRIAKSFAWGRYIYIDDLASLPEFRSKGHGAKLICWLSEYSKGLGCSHMHLDTAVTRHDAQRFYLNQRMVIAGYHFVRNL